jgi:hypothetical protein
VTVAGDRATIPSDEVARSGPHTGGLDEVRTRDGALYRGVVSEKTDARVVIVTAAGERREFAAADVLAVALAAESGVTPTVETAASATPTLSSPVPHGQAPTASPAPLSDSVPISFQATDERVTLHIYEGSATARAGNITAVAHAYGAVCEAPCETQLSRGRHRLALSRDGREPVEADAVTLKVDSATIDARPMQATP